MTPIEKAIDYLVSIAEAEIGYVEKATNSQLNDKTANPGTGNYTKYGAYFDAIRGEYEFYNGKKNGFDWCDQFNDAMFAWAFGIDAARRMLYQPLNSLGAGCKYSAGYYRENNAWTSVPSKGYQIFFGPKYDESHTGIVTSVSGDKVWTVEGNKSNRVMRCSYSISDKNIAGYGAPNYALVADRFKDPEPEPDPVEYVTEDQCEKLIEDVCGKWIRDVNDIPHKSVKAFARVLLDMQAVDGGTDYAVDPDDIRLPYNILRAVVIGARYTDARIKELEARLNG